MSLVNIVALGGVQETGKNLYVVEVDNDLFILDAGMKYPSSSMHGVDIILPDVSYIVSNANMHLPYFFSFSIVVILAGLNVITIVPMLCLLVLSRIVGCYSL